LQSRKKQCVPSVNSVRSVLRGQQQGLLEPVVSGCPVSVISPSIMVPVCTFSPLAQAYLVSPLWLYQFQVELCNQPDRTAIGYVLSGFWEGFSIGYEASPISLRSASSNMRSALVHPSVIDAYLQAEVSSGRIVGLFSSPPVPQLHISRLGVIPKSSHRQVASNPKPFVP